MRAVHRPAGALRVAVVLVLCARSASGADKSVPIIPVHGTPVAVSAGGKERTWYLAAAQRPVRVEVDGPGKLVVVSRLSMAAGGQDFETYSLRIAEGAREVKLYTTQTGRSNASYAHPGRVPGKSRKCTVDVPDGPHAYDVAVAASASGEAALRFTFTPARGRRRLVSLEALSYDNVRTVRAGEKLITYYIASRTRGVQVQVIGPTRLSVASRLNYDEKMKGGQKYGLAVTEGDRSVAVKAFATTKAVGTSFEDWKEAVPGKVNSFVIAVPEGEHRYTVSLVEGLAGSVSLKFSIPQGDLGREK